MINYIQGKEDECCSVRKQKIIDREAVAEVLDDDGNVVQSAQAEESHEELQLVKKQFNPMNGQALDDAVESFEISDIDKIISISFLLISFLTNGLSFTFNCLLMDLKIILDVFSIGHLIFC